MTKYILVYGTSYVKVRIHIRITKVKEKSKCVFLWSIWQVFLHICFVLRIVRTYITAYPLPCRILPPSKADWYFKKIIPPNILQHTNICSRKEVSTEFNRNLGKGDDYSRLSQGRFLRVGDFWRGYKGISSHCSKRKKNTYILKDSFQELDFQFFSYISNISRNNVELGRAES